MIDEYVDPYQPMAYHRRPNMTQSKSSSQTTVMKFGIQMDEI